MRLCLWNRSLAAMLAAQLACTGVASPPATSTTTSALEPLPTQPIVPSEPVGVTPVTHELTPSGAVTLRVDIKVPDGRAGMTPDVDLVYNSNGDNGLVGVGWQVSGFSSITRCPKIAALDGMPASIQWASTDAYCLDGVRLILASGSYGIPGSTYRTEDDKFARIAIETFGRLYGTWRVDLPDGRVARYGMTAATRFDGQWVSYANAAQPTPTLHGTVNQAWMIDEISDRSGNTVAYEYEKVVAASDAQAYEMRPTRIVYTGHSASPAQREVRFVYAVRSDRIDRWVSGLHRRETKRLWRIETYVGGSPVRHYTLTYRSDSITKRSLLSTVQECDGSGVCLPKTSFDWELGTWSYEAITTSIADVGVYSQSGYRLHVADINGDGRDDLLYPDENNVWWMRYSNGNGFDARIEAGLPHMANNYDSIVRINDFDRDGKIDVLAVDCRTTSDCTQVWALYQWDGTRFTRRYANVFGTTDSVSYGIVTFLLDLDGDGLADMVQSDSTGNNWFSQRFTGSTWTTLTNTGLDRNNYTHGYRVIDHDGDGRSELMRRDPVVPPANSLTGIGKTASGTWQDAPTNLPCGALGGTNFECGWREELRQLDVNGDGLEDAVFPWGGDEMLELTTRINSGRGFGPDRTGPSDYVPPDQYENSLLSGTSGAITEDMNNDGRDDLVLLFPGSGTSSPGTGIEIYASTPTGFTRVDVPFSAGTVNPWGWGTTRTADIDGDGLRDIVQIYSGKVRVLRRLGNQPDVITKVTPLQTGTLMRFAYADIAEPSIHTRATSCALPTRCAVRGVRVVTDAWLANGTSGENHISIRYTGGRRDLEGRGFVGFSSRNVTDDARRLVTTTTYNNLPTAGYYPYAGLPTSVRDKFSLTSGRLYERLVTNVWIDAGTLSTTHHAYLSRTTTEFWDRNSILIEPAFRAIVKRWTYDTYGNVTHAESQVTGGSTEVVDTVFDNRTSPWLLRLPTSKTMSRCTAGTCVTRTTSSSYDAYGRLVYSQRETPAIPDQYRRTTVVSRDSLGNPTVVSVATVAETRTTTTTYDDEGIYPAEVTDPLGHKHVIEVEPSLGKLTEVVDPNGVSTYLQYDGFGRFRGRKRDGDARTTVNYLAGTSPHPLAIKESTQLGNEIIAQLDKLGRVVEQTSRGLDGALVYGSFTYDVLGNLATRTRPHYAGEPAQVSTFQHDELGRLTRVTAPDGALERLDYVKLETSHYDALGRRTRHLHDVDGQLARTYEPHPSDASLELATQYVRGPTGIEAVVDPLGNRTSFGYDSLGRRRTVVDPDRGTTSYGYDAFDEVASVKHADGQVRSYVRDAGGRVTRVDSSDGTTSLAYDTTPGGIGKLVSATSPTGIVSQFRYDSFGRPIEQTWDIEGEQFSIARSYDAFGRVIATKYPTVTGFGSVVIDNIYDGYGHLREVQRAGAPLWRAELADATGQLEKIRLGNGIVELQDYDPERGWLDTITTHDPSGETIRAVDYDYDITGKLVTMRDLEATRFESYTYDRLDRLATWSVGQGPSLLRRTRFDYDVIGNLLREDVELGPGDDLAYVVGQAGFGPHQLASGPEGAYTYDARGRQKTGAQRTIDYTDFDLPRTIDRGGLVPSLTSFDYDAFGNRVLKTAADEETLTLAGLYERRGSSHSVEHRHHVRVHGRTVADIVIDGTGTEWTHYLHADRLGSVTMTTDGAGAVVERLRYDPFGQRVTDEDIPVPYADARRTDVREGFTGHTHDDELGLIDMKGRIFDPKTRRFLTGDPIVAELTSSQAWNPYSYVRNSPLNAIDPSGLFEESVGIDLLLEEQESDGSEDEMSEVDPEDTEPACEPDPVKQECEGGCPTGDDAQTSDAGVGDEVSDSANEPNESSPELPSFMQEAINENQQNGGKGIIYVLDYAEEEYSWKVGLAAAAYTGPVGLLAGYIFEAGEQGGEALAANSAIDYARAAGYTVKWVREDIDIAELNAIIQDTDTVGFVLDAHGDEGSIHLADDWMEASEALPGNTNLKFAIFVVCDLMQAGQAWADALGTTVVGWDTTISWGHAAVHSTLDRVFSEKL